MLFMLPFVMMAIIFTGVYNPSCVSPFVSERGVIDFSFMSEVKTVWKSVMGGVVILGITYIIFWISEKFKLLAQTTTLPSVIYVLLTCGISMHAGFTSLLVSVLIVAFALERLQMGINDTQTNLALFDFGFLVSLSVIIYPKFVFLLLWALCVLFFSGRSTLQDVMALLFGLLTPVVFVAFYYFWIEDLQQLPLLFTRHLEAGEYVYQVPSVEMIRLGILLFLLLVALIRLLGSYSFMVVNQRRGILALVSMFLFMSLTILMIPGTYYDFMYLLALPLSFIYAYFFISNRSAWFGNLMFLLLLAASFLAYFV